MRAPIPRSRTLVIVSVALVAMAFAGASFSRRANLARPLTGVEWAQSSTGPVAVRVDPTGPAGLGGLEVGDVLVGIDGRRVTSALDAEAMAWEPGPGSAIVLDVLRGSRTRQLLVRPEWRPGSEPYAYLFVVGVAFGLSGLLVVLRWPGVRAGTVYSLWCAAMFLYLTLSPTGLADGFDRAVEWINIVSGALGPALLFHVGAVMTKRTLPLRRTVVGAAYAMSGLLCLTWVWMSPMTAGGVYRFFNPRAAIEALDRFGYAFLAAGVIATAGLVFRSYGRSSSAMHRGQMRWLLWGLSIGLGPFLALYALPWALGGTLLPGWAQFLSVLPMLLVPAAFTAAMARYRLHDVDLLLLRGVSEVGAVLGTAAVYATTAFILREGIHELVPLPRNAVRYVGFLVAAVCYPQVRLGVRAAVEKAFYRQRYSYRATLLEWARELNAETDLASLLRRLRRRVRDTLGVDKAEVLVRAGERRFEVIDSPHSSRAVELDGEAFARLEQRACVSVGASELEALPWARYLFPMKVKDAVKAVLVTSERGDAEESLSTEDRSLLVTLAAHAGTAIEAARLVQEVRSRAEEIERLHAQQARILESSAVGLLLLDSEGRILAWNRALEEMYGLARGKAIGHRLRDVFPLHVVRQIERTGAAGGGEDARIYRLGLVNHRGERVVINIAISETGDASPGDDGRRVVTFDDVTEHVRLEEQVLQQERLASLGLLAAGVAHEINTPLTGISSYTQLLLEELAHDDPRRPVLEKIETQTARASKIANSLLTLARPERTAFEETDLNETIREVLQLFEPQVRGRDIQLRADLGPGLTPVLGHRGKLQQVFLNLLLNARDAVGEGGEIRVRSGRAGDRVFVEVLDDGVGIGDEDLPRIFDPFFTTKGRGKGTGLGLSITYGIVEEHEGRIRADRETGMTRFRVELPTARAYRAAAP